MRAIEKGATYLDKLCHKFYDEPKGCGNKTDYVCRLCGGPLETYYCEERLYLVQCADCGTFSLVKTANPEDAARVTLARPTLTPPNEWVSVEERLPEPGERVLAAKGTFVGEAYLASNGAWMRHDGFPWQVDAWMPLPAPPGKDNNVPTNEPLTIEELREMDGEPVWVEEVKHWALIDIEKGGQWDGIPFAVWAENGTKFTYNIKNRGLHCYRRPPEGEEDI